MIKNGTRTEFPYPIGNLEGTINYRDLRGGRGSLKLELKYEVRSSTEKRNQQYIRSFNNLAELGRFIQENIPPDSQITPVGLPEESVHELAPLDCIVWDSDIDTGLLGV